MLWDSLGQAIFARVRDEEDCWENSGIQSTCTISQYDWYPRKRILSFGFHSLIPSLKKIVTAGPGGPRASIDTSGGNMWFQNITAWLENDPIFLGQFCCAVTTCYGFALRHLRKPSRLPLRRILPSWAIPKRPGLCGSFFLGGAAMQGRTACLLLGAWCAGDHFFVRVRNNRNKRTRKGGYLPPQWSI